MYESYAIMRDSKGLKDSDVAKETGISKSTFSEWKSGRSEPKIDKLYKIARVLNCDVNDFYYDFTPRALKKLEITAQTDEERELLLGFRAASKEGRGYMLHIASEALKKGEADKSSNSAREEVS